MMIPKFKIERVSKHDYIIKKKIFFLFMVKMTKNEFFGDLTNYGDNILSLDIASFKTIELAQNALRHYSKINGIQRVIVKISNKMKSESNFDFSFINFN